MPMTDFCAHGTLPLRPESPPELISHKAVSPRRCSEIGHPETTFSSQFVNLSVVLQRKYLQVPLSTVVGEMQ